MVKQLQRRGNVPPSCDKRIVEISNSIWTQLTNNEWIYFVPTILCMDGPPVDVIVSGIGKLRISASCKGFGKAALFQTHAIPNMDHSSSESDFISKVNLEYDCCEKFKLKLNISHIHLNTSFRHVVSHLEDLRIGNNKVSNVENIIEERKRKRLHTTSHNTYSALVYTRICLILKALYVIYKVYNYLKGKANCVKTITDTSGYRKHCKH
jgi:hypothetical protein